MVNYANLRTSGGYSDAAGEHDVSGNLIRSAEQIQQQNQQKQVQQIINTQSPNTSNQNALPRQGNSYLQPGNTQAFDRAIFGIGTHQTSTPPNTHTLVQEKASPEPYDQNQQKFDLSKYNKQDLQYELLTNPQLKFDMIMQDRKEDYNTFLKKQQVNKQKEKLMQPLKELNTALFGVVGEGAKNLVEKKQYSQLPKNVRRNIEYQSFIYENKDKSLKEVVPEEIYKNYALSQSSKPINKLAGWVMRTFGPETKKELAIDKVNTLYKYKANQIKERYGIKEQELEQKTKEYNKIARIDLKAYNNKIEQINKLVKARDEYARQHGRLVNGVYLLPEDKMTVINFYDEQIKNAKEELNTPKYQTYKKNIDKLSTLKKEIDTGLEKQKAASKDIKELNKEYEGVMGFLSNYNYLDKLNNYLDKKRYEAKTTGGSELYDYAKTGVYLADIASKPVKFLASIGENAIEEGEKGNLNILTPVARSVYDYKESFNLVRPWYRKINMENVAGATVLLGGVGGALGKTGNMAIRSFKAVGVGVPVSRGISVLGKEIVYEGIGLFNKDFRNMIHTKGGQVVKLTEKGYEGEYKTIGNGLRSWAVQNAPFMNEVFGKKEEYLKTIGQQAQKSGFNQKQVNVLKNDLGWFRHFNNVITVASVFGANTASEIMGGTSFKAFKVIDKPFRQSFVTVFPAGALEGAVVYTAQQSGTTNKLSSEGLIANAVGGGISAGIISGVINKGMAGSLFGGKTARAVQASQKVGKFTEGAGYVYDLYEWIGDKAARIVYPRAFKNIPKLKVKTFTAGNTMTQSNMMSNVVSQTQENTLEDKVSVQLKEGYVKGLKGKNVAVNSMANVFSNANQQEIQNRPSINSESFGSTETQAETLENSEINVNERSNINTLTETETNIKEKTSSDTTADTDTTSDTDTDTASDTSSETSSNTESNTQASVSTYSSVFPVPYGRVGMPGGPYGGNSYSYFTSWIRNNKIKDLAGAFFGRIKNRNQVYNKFRQQPVAQFPSTFISVPTGKSQLQQKTNLYKEEYERYKNKYNTQNVVQNLQVKQKLALQRPERMAELNKYKKNYNQQITQLRKTVPVFSK